MMESMRHTKIVATFGPATQGDTTTRELIKSGGNVARLNFSHVEHQVHTHTYKTVRKVASELCTPVAVSADLQSPKIRLATFDHGPNVLEDGVTFFITARDVEGTKDICSTTFKGLPQDVAVGDQLL